MISASYQYPMSLHVSQVALVLFIPFDSYDRYKKICSNCNHGASDRLWVNYRTPGFFKGVQQN